MRFRALEIARDIRVINPFDSHFPRGSRIDLRFERRAHFSSSLTRVAAGVLYVARRGRRRTGDHHRNRTRLRSPGVRVSGPDPRQLRVMQIEREIRMLLNIRFNC